MINRAINRFLLNMNMNPSLFVSFGGSIVQSTPYEQLKIDLVDGLWIVLHAYFVWFSRTINCKGHLNKIELILFRLFPYNISIQIKILKCFQLSIVKNVLYESSLITSKDLLRQSFHSFVIFNPVYKTVYRPLGGENFPSFQIYMNPT